MEYQDTAMTAGKQPPNRGLNPPSAPRPSRPMEGIGAAADRVSCLTDRINGILSRMQDRPETAGNDISEPVSFSYLDQVARLHANLDVLEKLTAELAELA